MAQLLLSSVVLHSRHCYDEGYKVTCAYDIFLHVKFSTDCYSLRVIDPQKFISTTENKLQHNLKNIYTHKSKN